MQKRHLYSCFHRDETDLATLSFGHIATFQAVVSVCLYVVEVYASELPHIMQLYGRGLCLRTATYTTMW